MHFVSILKTLAELCVAKMKTLEEQIQEQGELVRKLKAAKAEPAQISSQGFKELLGEFNQALSNCSYVCGWNPSKKDSEFFCLCCTHENGGYGNFPHLKRWFDHMKSFSKEELSALPEPKKSNNALESKINSLIAVSSGDLDKKIAEEVSKLLSMKKELGGDSNASPAQKVLTKTPKGSRDFNSVLATQRKSVISKISSIFEKHGIKTIDTPIFELKDILTGKYGEDSKLIYDLENQDGEVLALRYDLTVPFARYLAMNQIKNMKRYQIAKVYRRDNPAMTKGRYREFYQCDFDVAGQYDSMQPDSECIKIIYDALKSLELGPFKIKVNHRCLLDGIFAACGVPQDKFRTICSAVDKLDKSEWEEVRKEMVEEKGLDGAVADRIGTYVSKSGKQELVEELRKDAELMKQPAAEKGLKDMEILFKYCGSDETVEGVTFDLSLARGLDYYTGIIFEAILTGDNVGVGSVAGGGRYDNLVGMFDPENNSVPCVGMSLGIERIFSVLEALNASRGTKIRTTEVQVFVASAQKNLHKERMKILKDLRQNDIKATHSLKKSPKLLAQLQHCEEYDIPLAIIIGENELKKGEVTLRNVKTREETSVSRDKLVEELRNRLDSADLPNQLQKLQISNSEVTTTGKKLKQNGFLLKTANGAKDYHAEQMDLRKQVSEKIEFIFKKYGPEPIDTPVFELKEVLTGKYGENEKLIYYLKDQGGEILALRYDLTVPFARYLAMNKITNLTRYHIAKVYRRDNPVMDKGRYREFYQCDFDIAGQYDSMLPESECIGIIHDVLKSLELGSFKIKVNHRRLLSGIFAAYGVKAQKFLSIYSAMDKLDQASWSEVQKKLIEGKVLDEEKATKIGAYIAKGSNPGLLEEIRNDSELMKQTDVKQSIEEIELLVEYCNSLDIATDVVFDISLARGIDYYTGIVFEAVLTDDKIGVSSVAAGGRYDKLVGIFDKKKSVPCVGLSLGFEPILCVLESSRTK